MNWEPQYKVGDSVVIRDRVYHNGKVMGVRRRRWRRDRYVIEYAVYIGPAASFDPDRLIGREELRRGVFTARHIYEGTPT